MNNKLVIKKDFKDSILEKKNITVNYYCTCKKKYNQNDKIYFILPCSHLFHEGCIQNKTNCPICKCKIKKILSEEKIFSSSKYLNYQNDIRTVKTKNTGFVNYKILPIGILNLTAFFNKACLIENQEQFINTLEFLLRIINVKINIIDKTTNKNFYLNNNILTWKYKEDKDAKKVIIANHSHYLDSFILYYVFRCGFVSSDAINHLELGRLIVSLCKLVIFKRGVDTNMVEKIKEYLEKMKQIVIYPEGIMKDNNDILVKFRTGAFYTGANICPVIIKYRNFIYDEDFKELIFKLLTQQEIGVDVYICDMQYPPFNNESIENIRILMANIGNLKLSRVSNKDVIE
jgi:1-acyl-sn-glycerol-3-phosphate acyltransferase